MDRIRPGFILPVRVLAKLFRGLMLDKLMAAHAAGKLNFFGSHIHLGDAKAFKRFLRPAWRRKWYVDARPPFAGPRQVLSYLSRYTHRLAISNRRLIRADADTVTFKVKDYRLDGQKRHTTMTLATSEFIRRFLSHVLPKGLHCIRHYGLFANANRKNNLARMRLLLKVEPQCVDEQGNRRDREACNEALACPCPCCGGTMRIIEVFAAGQMPRIITIPEGIDSS